MNVVKAPTHLSLDIVKVKKGYYRLITTLKSEDIIAGKEVSFYYKSRLIGKGITNSEGLAILLFDTDDLGTLNFKVVFEGSTEFLSSEDDNEIVVKKNPNVDPDKNKTNTNGIDEKLIQK
ncbi:hypothetical protein ALNOE001_16830 [Candidatus Methanobinarius endosymbioticus]|uniref:Uncharacterized protein n=1 Tax=Candidatus Methanobinarius endosymbioticus TaxID=2006182 RepID=A0A366M8V3_9EURY|nr:hypothetical protein ALNOE001_16830 [Candidatus Methanobinarius endosymbioticus]